MTQERSFEGGIPRPARRLLAAIVAGGLAAPGLAAPLLAGSVYDGSITSSAGTFILNGQLPYRDFWLLYGPLPGAVAAVLNAAFGNEVVVLRLAGLLLLSLTAVAGYEVVARVAPGILGWTTAVVAAVVPSYFVGLDLAPWQIALFFALVAIRVAEARDHRSILIAGALVGLSGLGRLDVAAYAAIALIVQTRSLRILIGAAAVGVPFAILFLLLVPWPALIEQLIWFPAVGTQVFRRVPGPDLFGLFGSDNPLDWLLYFAPILLIVGALLRLARTRAAPAVVIGLLVFALLCRLQTIGRADTFHAAQAFGPGFLLAAYVFTNADTLWKRAGTALVGMVPVAMAFLPLLWLARPPDPYEQALTDAAAIVRANTSPGEPIFVGQSRNDYGLQNPLIVYFLADRPAGVRDTAYNPGVTTTDATQQRMVNDLASNNVRYLVLDVLFAGCYELQNESRVRGSTILDEAITARYRLAADLGVLVVMAPRDEADATVMSHTVVAPRRPYSDLVVCEPSSRPE